MATGEPPSGSVWVHTNEVVTAWAWTAWGFEVAAEAGAEAISAGPNTAPRVRHAPTVRMHRRAPVLSRCCPC